VLDLQGAELQALLGAKVVLSKFDYIYTEVSIDTMYKDQPKWADVTCFLKKQGFRLVDWQIDQEKGWGNALYLRKARYPKSYLKRKRRAKLHALLYA
jgi:hypothetical protein